MRAKQCPLFQATYLVRTHEKLGVYVIMEVNLVCIPPVPFFDKFEMVHKIKEIAWPPSDRSPMEHNPPWEFVGTQLNKPN